MLQATPVQTSYSQYPDIGQPGTWATMTGGDADTRLLEDPDGNGAGFGLAVCQGTLSDMGVTLGALSGGAFIGITLADPTLSNLTTTAIDKYQDGENVGVARRGDVWVQVPADLEFRADGPVYFNSVTGEFGGSDIDNAALVSNARWQTSLPNVDFAHYPSVTASRMAIVRLGALASSS